MSKPETETLGIRNMRIETLFEVLLGLLDGDLSCQLRETAILINLGLMGMSWDIQ